MKKISAIDIGTNSVKHRMFEYDNKSNNWKKDQSNYKFWEKYLKNMQKQFTWKESNSLC